MCGCVKIYSSLIELLFLSKNSFCILPYILFYNGMKKFIVITKIMMSYILLFFYFNPVSL